MRSDGNGAKRPRLWARWLGLALLPAVPALALVVLSPHSFGAASDLTAVRDGVRNDFLVLDAPGTAHAARPQARDGATDTSAEVETRLNNWTPTLGGASRGN